VVSLCVSLSGCLFFREQLKKTGGWICCANVEQASRLFLQDTRRYKAR
jgi:hypothetical protein